MTYDTIKTSIEDGKQIKNNIIKKEKKYITTNTPNCKKIPIGYHILDNKKSPGINVSTDVINSIDNKSKIHKKVLYDGEIDLSDKTFDDLHSVFNKKKKQSSGLGSSDDEDIFPSVVPNDLKNNDIGKTSSISDMSDIGDAVNKANKKKEGANNIVVMTKDDNLIHNYFYDYECWWDANNCLSGAIIKMPKTQSENTNYWINYKDDIVIFMGNNIPSNMLETKYTDGTTNNDAYWDLKDMKPFFQGKIARIKEHEDDLVLYVESIGRRFKAKIPKEFRESFIFNQNVRDAFQAICEFLGVYYICPPQQKTEDGEEEEDSAESDGTENDASKTLAKEEKLASKAVNKVKSTQDKLNKNKPNKDTTNSDGTEEEEAEEEEEENTEEPVDDVQTNGYDDISFDSGGNIVHGSTVIETSPDMAQTLLQMTENPLSRGNYEEEGNEWILKDIEKLLDGEMFEELHNEVMSYNAITIEPKSATTSDMSTTGTTGGSDESQMSEDESREYNATAAGTGRSKIKNGWINGQYYINGKIYLSKQYINSLSRQQAHAKYVKGENVYTPDTLQKLQWRSWGIPLL